MTCVNNDCADAGFISRYKWFKWLLPLIFLLPLLLLLSRSCGGNTGAVTTPVVASTAVPAPACDTLTGAAVAGSDVTFTGSTQPNGAIRLVANDNLSLGSTTANSSGDWSLTTKFLSAGSYDVAARLMDGDTILSRCDAQSVSVSAPAMAEIAKPTINSLGAAKLGALTLAGTGTAGSLLEIYCNGRAIGTTTADSSGNWSYDSSHDEPGEYEYAAFAKDGNGDVLISDSATALIAAPEPEATPEPVVEATPEPEPVAATTRPVISSASGGQPSSDPVVVTGTAGASCQVSVYANGVEFASTVADADGNWSVSEALNEDTYDIVARSSCEGAATKQSNSATLAVGSGVPVGFTVEVTDEPADESGSLGLGGVAPEGDLQIYTGDTLLGTTTALDGSWNFVSTCSLPPGEYELNVQASDGSAQTVSVNVPNLAPAYEPPRGDPGVSYEKLVCTGTPEFGQIIGTTYIIAPCESMSLIAQRMGTTLAEIIRYNPQVTEPSAIYAGQILNIPSGASCLDQ